MIWPAIPDDINATVLALAKQLATSQWWSPDRIWAHQARQLKNLCAFAARSTPYYRGRLDHILGEDLTPELWRTVPILGRQDIQQAGTGLHSEDVPATHGAMATSHTSGSTGRPIEINRTSYATVFVRAINLRYHIWHGRDFESTSASIRNLRGKMLQDYEDGKTGLWVPSFRSGPMHAFPITRPIPEQVDWLMELKPQYLVTHASNMPHLMDETVQRGIRPEGLREVSTMGDCIPDGLRERCREVWGVPLHDLYSCQESGLLAMECPEYPHYHVQSESVLIEIVDENGALCRPGQLGRVLITDLQNLAMPLIRYEIGDYAEPGEPCTCGRGLPVIKRIVGRFRNLLVLPDGRRFYPRFTSVTLTKVAPIKQMQLVQHTLTKLEAKFVVDRALTEDEENRLREEILGTTDHPYEIDFAYVDEIPRSPGGKYEDVVCLVDDR